MTVVFVHNVGYPVQIFGHICVNSGKAFRAASLRSKAHHTNLVPVGRDQSQQGSPGITFARVPAGISPHAQMILGQRYVGHAKHFIAQFVGFAVDFDVQLKPAENF